MSFLIKLVWRGGLTIVWALALPSLFGSVSSARMELYSTYHCVGIEISHDSKDTEQIHAEFQYRVHGSEKWKNGVDMTHDSKSQRIWASAFRFEPGQTVDIRALLRDSVSGGERILEGTTTLRVFKGDTAGGRVIHVRPDGNDRAEGGEKTSFSSIQRAVRDLRPGDSVTIHPGFYPGGVELKGIRGTPEAPIVIRGSVSNIPATTISVRFPYSNGDAGVFPVLTGLQNLSSDAVWKAHGADIYSTPVFDLAVGERDWGYVMIDGGRMYWYQDLNTLRENPIESRKKGKKQRPDVERKQTARLKGSKHEALPAWAYDGKGKMLYVRMEPGKHPQGHRFAYASHSYGIRLIDCSNIVIRDLEVAYHGVSCISLDGNADGVTLFNNLVHHAPNVVSVVDSQIDETTVWNNHIYDRGFHLNTWRAWMSSGYGYHGLVIKGGRGISVVGNRVHDVFNAIPVNSTGNEDNLQAHRDMDVIENYSYNTGDDALEPDGGGVNLRILNNRNFNTLENISLAPIERGPVYVVGNYGVNRNYTFKFNVGKGRSLGACYLYHNTGYAVGNGTKAVQMPNEKQGVPFANKVLKNNIFLLGGDFINGGNKGARMDANCYWNVKESARSESAFNWEGVNYSTLDDFRKATGNEKRGIFTNPQLAGAPKWTSDELWDAIADAREIPFDLSLSAGSPCVDKGEVIRGINEDFNGKAPDLGAFESR